MMSGYKLLTGVAAAALLASGCNTAPAAVAPDGTLLFVNNCAPCHGATGVGLEEIAAPNIAGLPQWYVEAQVLKFRDGTRGAHFDDIAGLRMRPMSRTLTGEHEVTAVSAYVASLPVVQPPLSAGFGDPSIVGDAELGKVYYATCAACHGADAKGNQTLNAPPLDHANDWYMLTQLQHFKAGIRGAEPRDVTGAQMRPMSMMLADEKAMKDVIAYIQTL